MERRGREVASRKSVRCGPVPSARSPATCCRMTTSPSCPLRRALGTCSSRRTAACCAVRSRPCCTSAWPRSASARCPTTGRGGCHRSGRRVGGGAAAGRPSVGRCAPRRPARRTMARGGGGRDHGHVAERRPPTRSPPDLDLADARIAGVRAGGAPAWATVLAVVGGRPAAWAGAIGGQRVVVLGFDPDGGTLAERDAFPRLIGRAIAWAAPDMLSPVAARRRAVRPAAVARGDRPSGRPAVVGRAAVRRAGRAGRGQRSDAGACRAPASWSRASALWCGRATRTNQAWRP